MECVARFHALFPHRFHSSDRVGSPHGLLDEPTSGLDPNASHEFSRLLHKLRERGIAILIATHDPFRAKEDATRVGIMRHGRLVREFTAAELSHADLEKFYLETMRE